MPRHLELILTTLLLFLLSACTGDADPVDLSPLGERGTPALREDAAGLLGQWLDVHAAGGDDDAPARSLSWLLAWWWQANPADVAPEALTSPRPTAVVFTAEAASFLWTVTEDGVAWHRRPGRAELTALVDTVLADLGRPGGTARSESARRLADLLVGPLVTDWTGGRELQLLADDAVWPAPLAALPDPRYEDGRPLIWFGPVRWLQGWASGLTAGHHTRQVSRLLAVGRHGAAADLARGLSDGWHGESATLRTAEASSWASLGELDLRAYDAVLMADPAQCDGKALELPDDLAPLSALADRAMAGALVVLPSCGLQHGQALCEALGAARARTVILGASDSDEASAALTTAFFRYWNDGSSAADALRMAMLEMESGGPSRTASGWGRYRVVVVRR